MAYERFDDNPLNYDFCRYGGSKMLFRGPCKDLSEPYNVCIGGTETFGKYVAQPFAQLIEEQTQTQMINFGAVNAGVDAFVKDPAILTICAEARTTIIQTMGAQNMSNRYYSVHPRRNDRFLKASSVLQSIFPEVDFTEFSFTRHMLMTLSDISAERFELVEQELRNAWLSRMQQMIGGISGRVILLAFTDQRTGRHAEVSPLGTDPLYVDKAMIDRLRPRVSAVAQIDITDEIASGTTEGMVYPSLEREAAAALPGPEFHAHVAEKLSAML